MAIFGLFELLFFIAQKGVFSFQNIVKHIFLADIAEKKKLKKWPFLDQNHGLTSLEKYQFFHFLIFLFLQPRKAFFFVLEDRKRHFPGPFFLNKELEKWPFLYQKPWVNPFGKMAFFCLFKLFFYSVERRFFCFRISQNTFSLPILEKKKNLSKNPFLSKNHGLTPLEKWQFFDFLNYLFLQPRKVFFRSRMS